MDDGKMEKNIKCIFVSYFRHNSKYKIYLKDKF